MAWEHFHLGLKTQVTYMCVRVCVCVYIYIHNWGKEKKLVGHSPFSKSYKWVRAEDSKCSSHNFFNAATIQNTVAYRLPGRQCSPARAQSPPRGGHVAPRAPATLAAAPCPHCLTLSVWKTRESHVNDEELWTLWLTTPSKPFISSIV